MPPQSKSKWAEDDTVGSEDVTRRKREKEEKRRLKEVKSRQSASTSSAPLVSQTSSETGERPAKRQRTEHRQEVDNGTEDQREGADLQQFPVGHFGPARRVDEFELLNNIEEGSYGMVSRARTKATGEIVALKRLKMEQSQANDGFPVTGLREILTLKACQHPNVVALRQVVMGERLLDVYLVMEFLEHDLSTLLSDMAEPFLPSETKALMLQVTSGLSYLHSHYILHRDLKTSNLLLNNRGELKIADFGMARYTSSPPPKLTQLVVTLWYRSPELLLGAEQYGPEIDVWSLGCIFGELLTKSPLFTGSNEVKQLSQVIDLLGTPTKARWPGFRTLPNAKALHPLLSSTNGSPKLTHSKFPHLTNAGLQLIISLLSYDPASRPSPDEVLLHPYFKEDPRPKPKAMFPTFPSKAGQEKRRKILTPQAPARGEAPKLEEKDFEALFSTRGD